MLCDIFHLKIEKLEYSDYTVKFQGAKMKRGIFFLILSLVFLTKNLTAKNVVFIPERDLPRKIGIVGPIAMSDKNIELPALGMVRNVIKNYMAGKGYIIYELKMETSLPKKESFNNIKNILNHNPNVDGILTIHVYRLSSFNMAFAQYYKMDGELCLYNKKKKLGCWRESSTRKKLSIATDPLGAIATIVSSVVSSEGNVNIKNVIFDWAFKISSLIPTFSSATKKPKILRVVTNVSNSTFKIGDKIVVGLEGSSGGNAYFDIKPLIKRVPMPEVENGIYKGMYIVKEGDKLKNGIIYVHLKNEQGEKRDWLETSPLVNIDGIPPSPVKQFTYKLKEDGIELKWHTTDTDTVKFEIYKSRKPIEGYKKIMETSNFSCIDRDVVSGVSYFYRIISVDRTGNRSKPVQIGPISLPSLKRKVLPDVILSSIPPGKYYLNSTCVIPLGSKIVLGPDVDIEFRDNSTLKIEGQLEIKNSFIHTDNSNGTKKIYVAETSHVKISNLKIKGLDGLYVYGDLKSKNLYIQNSKNGIYVESTNKIDITNSTFKELNTGVILKDGNISVTGCNFKKNKIAIYIKNGVANIANNNFMDNKINIKSEVPIKIKTNFLGSIEPDKFRIKGKVKIISILSSPYPGAKEISLEKLIADAKKQEYKAIAFLNEGKYKEAVKLFKKAIPIYSDSSSYIYYIYALSMIQDPSIEEIIEDALSKYPNEVRIYQMGIRYFLQVNKKDKAKKLLDKGLKLNPDDPTLKSMKVFFY